MLTDIDKEFDTPEIDENGELIETIETEEVFEDVDNAEPIEKENYDGEDDDIALESEDEEFDDIQEVTVESKEKYYNAKEQLVAIFTSILEAGEITAEDNANIEELKEQYAQSYNDIKENVEGEQKKTLEERIQELSDGMVGASTDDILAILTDNGRKPWLYKNEDNEVLVDGTSIPELTFLVKKLNLIATDGENEGEFQLTPEFINMVVKNTGAENPIKDIVIQYYSSTSNTEVKGGEWVENLPETSTNKYIWMRIKTTYMDANKAPSFSAPICLSASKGENGADGVDGKDGVSIIWQGSKSNHPASPQNGWAYYNTIDKKSYVYQSGSWYQMTIDGQDGINGNNGKDGLSIEYKGIMANPPSNPQKNWTYKDSDNGIVYIYTGTAWEILTYDGSNGQDGADGQNGLSIFVTYNDSVTQPAAPTGNGTTNGWHTNSTTSSVWISQKVASSATTGTWGTPIKVKGEPGIQGNGVKSTQEEFYLSSDKVNQPSETDPNWTSKCPQWQPGKYIWTRIKMTYTNNNVEFVGYSVDTSWEVVNDLQIGGRNLIIRRNELKDKMIGIDGNVGIFVGSCLMLDFIKVSPGETLLFSQTHNKGGDSYYRYAFYASDQTTIIRRTPNDATQFKEVVPEGAYWLRVSYDGNNQVKIERGDKFTDWSLAPEDNVANVDVMFYLSTSNISLAGGTWQTTAPPWTDGKYMWQKTVTTLGNGQTTETQPTCIAGANGQDGTSVEEVIIQYSKNQSTTTPPVDGWGTSMPSYQEGYFLWIRTRIKYSNNANYVYSTPICDQSWKANAEVYTQYKQLKEKFSWIVKNGTSESNMELTDALFKVLTETISLTAKNINLNGYISNEGGNFALDQQGNMEVQDLSVKGEFSCESLTSNTLNNPRYPEALDGSMNVNIDETNGSDDVELADGATFQSIGGFFNKCPKNLNGRTINVSFKTDITENVSISYFYCGRIRFYCEGHKITGWVRMEYIPTLSQMFGGSVSDPYGSTGIIMPYVGLNQGSVSASFVNYGSVNTALYNVKVYKAVNLASGCTESVAVASGNNGYTYVSDVTPINCEYGFRTNSHGRIHSNSSGGKASKYGFVAVSGGYITLSNGQHTGGTTDNTYFSSGGQVIPGSGATFVGTAEGGSNTSTNVNTTKIVTYTSNSGNTYRTTYSSWRNDGGVIQGNAYGSGNCIGYWFFGSQFLDLKGCSEISKVVLKVKRLKIGSWSSKLSLKLGFHNQTGKQTTPYMPAYFQATDIGAYSGDYVSITITDQTVLDRIKAGTLKGFALYDSNFASGSYGGCSGTAKVTITYKE